MELEELPAAQPQVSLEVLVEVFFGVRILVWVWLGFWNVMTLFEGVVRFSWLGVHCNILYYTIL